ncbi:MAG: Bpu10I family restriction endonuclease [Nitrospirae bacterium]|nr:Bpu10I family restriction endonuclease [Nitrospirota bacterium]
MPLATPHFEKLLATLNNDKLPTSDKQRIKEAIEEYKKWRKNCLSIMESEKSVDTMLNKLIENLNKYKNFIEIDTIFDSENDFLYRQKGQLKLDNTIIEEFLPFLINSTLIPEIKSIDISVGPTPSFSAVYFSSSLDIPKKGGGLTIRTKNQDFAISKKLYIKASHSSEFNDSESVVEDTNIAYIAAECKTNLDKTMFQEACATAHDTKSAVPGSKYFLLIEWLDMTPLSTAPTDIDEVILLRKAKRINSNIRQYYSVSKNRKEKRKEYVEYILKNPIHIDGLKRFIAHIKNTLTNEGPNEDEALKIGYF